MNGPQVDAYLSRLYFEHNETGTLAEMDADKSVPQGINPARWRGMVRRVNSDYAAAKPNQRVVLNY